MKDKLITIKFIKGGSLTFLEKKYLENQEYFINQGILEIIIH